MTVNLKTASLITGISYQTISRHIKEGILLTSEDNPHRIEIIDLHYYAKRRWAEGRCLMYPVNTFSQRVSYFYQR